MLYIIDRLTLIAVDKAKDIEEAKIKLDQLKKKNPKREFYVREPN